MRTALLLALALSCSVACGPKKAPVSVASAPKFPDLVAPVVPPSFARTPAAAHEDRGWALLQAGDLDQAEREFKAALQTPAFYPAEISLGLVALARNDSGAALTWFDRAAERGRSDPAAAADPAFVDLTRRIEVLKFRRLEANLTRARGAARAGRLDEAIRTYLAAIAESPESPILFRELASVERQKGDGESALEHLRSAVWLDPGDARSLVEIGQLLEERRDFDGALKAYRDAIAIEPSAEVQARLDAVTVRAEVSRLPAEYRAIDEAVQISRGDLAALIGVRLAPLVEVDPRRTAVLITDLGTYWAAPWIRLVTHAGLMEPFENHTFQPRAIVRRADLALTVSRVLARIAELKPGQEAWAAARLKFPDLPTGHLAYRAASAAVAAGVLQPGADNRFQPTRVVSGGEAVGAIGRLQQLAGIPVGRGGRP